MIKPLHVVTILCLGSIVNVIAQGQESATSQNLVAEVRQLRIAVERLTAIMPRMQITLQRLQLQEQHLTEVSRELKEIRDQAMRATADQTRGTIELQQADIAVAREQDPTRLSIMKERQAQMKSNLERVAQTVQILSVRETEGSAALRLAQSKVDEFSDQLTKLDRELGGGK